MRTDPCLLVTSAELQRSQGSWMTWLAIWTCPDGHVRSLQWFMVRERRRGNHASHGLLFKPQPIRAKQVHTASKQLKSAKDARAIWKDEESCIPCSAAPSTSKRHNRTCSLKLGWARLISHLWRNPTHRRATSPKRRSGYMLGTD